MSWPNAAPAGAGGGSSSGPAGQRLGSWPMASRTAAARKTASTAEAQDSPHRDELAGALLTGAAIAMPRTGRGRRRDCDGASTAAHVPGRHEQVAQARRFVGRILAGCQVTDEAGLCVSELAT